MHGTVSGALRRGAGSAKSPGLGGEILSLWLALLACVLSGFAAQAAAQGPAPAASAGVARQPLRLAAAQGRLTSREIGLVINTADPYSVAVGEHYIAARQLAPEQVLRIELPLRAQLTEEEFTRLRVAIAERFGSRTQALALAWRLPYAVSCNGISGALALGFDASLCEHGCSASRPSAYFNSPTARPWTDLRLRPSMLLAAKDVESALRMIDRGVASDGTLGLRGAPPAQAWFVTTADAARNVRAVEFPTAGRPAPSVDVRVEPESTWPETGPVILYLTGRVRVDRIETIPWAAGALADHLTSTGGVLDGDQQMPATAWIDAGATASYGTVSEPCNHLQKFPQPKVLLGQYMQGVTAIEAYWKSVAWPQQGVFVGEPLAAPFSRVVKR